MSEKRKNREKVKEGGGIGVFLCRAVRTALLLLIVLTGALLVLPGFLEYKPYTIISGSMEPSIPLGSVVYARSVKPEQVQPGDVIVFYGGRNGDAVTTHRVVENRTVEGEFITRGDANADNDMLPRPYGSFIGRVELAVPLLGRFLTALSGTAGRAGLLGIVAAIIGLYFLEAGLRREEGRG